MGTRIPVSINGNLVADPELSYGESGIAHAKLRIAVNQRFQAAVGTWRDGIPRLPQRLRVQDACRGCRSFLEEGDPVIITGDLEFRSYEKDGTQHEARRIIAEVVGPDIRFGTTSYERTSKPIRTVTISNPVHTHSEPEATNGSGRVPTLPATSPSAGGFSTDGLRMKFLNER